MRQHIMLEELARNVSSMSAEKVADTIKEMDGDANGLTARLPVPPWSQVYHSNQLAHEPTSIARHRVLYQTRKQFP